MHSMRNFMSTLSLTLAVGCGGSTAISPQDGGPPDDGTNQKDTGGQSDSGAPVDSGALIDAWGIPADGGPWSPECPATLPSQGAPCSPDMLQCEYGNAWWNVSCDMVVRCVGGSWANFQPGETCFPKPGPNSPSCPMNPGMVAIGTACPQVGVTCWYGEGTNCVCNAPFTDGGPPEWFCTPPTGCPGSRPRLGAGCTNSPLCLYNGCFGEECQNGIWQNVTVGCQ